MSFWSWLRNLISPNSNHVPAPQPPTNPPSNPPTPFPHPPQTPTPEPTAPDPDGFPMPPVKPPTGELFIPSQYYYMRPTQGAINFPSDVVENPLVEGFTIRGRWADIEPQRGKYNFDRLEGAILRLSQLKKKAKLTIESGVYSPAWLKGNGIPYMNFAPEPNRQGEPTTMPVPFDQNYLDRYLSFAAEVAKRFDTDPTVSIIDVAGPTQYSCEAHLPSEVLNFQNFESKIKYAWLTCFKVFAGLFPNTVICWNIAPFAKYYPNTHPFLAGEFYRILGKRAYIQHCSLSAKSTMAYQIHKLVHDLGNAGRFVGFEEVCGSSQARFGGSFEEAYQKAKAAKGKVMSIYEPDQRYAKPL